MAFGQNCQRRLKSKTIFWLRAEIFEIYWLLRKGLSDIFTNSLIKTRRKFNQFWTFHYILDVQIADATLTELKIVVLALWMQHSFSFIPKELPNYFPQVHIYINIDKVSSLFAAYKLLCYHRRNLSVCVSRIARPSGRNWVGLYEGGVRYGGQCM